MIIFSIESLPVYIFGSYELSDPFELFKKEKNVYRILIKITYILKVIDQFEVVFAKTQVSYIKTCDTKIKTKLWIINLSQSF